MPVDQQLSGMELELSTLLARALSIWREEEELFRQLQDIDRRIARGLADSQASNGETGDA